jgi:hypothetical protein
MCGFLVSQGFSKDNVVFDTWMLVLMAFVLRYEGIHQLVIRTLSGFVTYVNNSLIQGAPKVPHAFVFVISFKSLGAQIFLVAD